MSIELGSIVKDVVSGWKGMATARYVYLNGCERYEVSGADKEGKPEAFVFDVQQLTIVTPPKPKVPAKPQTTRAGGPRGNRPVVRS